jgi:mannosyltransferase
VASVGVSAHAKVRGAAAGVVARARAFPYEQALASNWAVPALLALATVVSLYLRTRALNAAFWIDEGLSVGIAHHHWTSIPGLLRQDGSPPAYYMLLGLWVRVFGDGVRATHVLSVVFAMGCIPLSYWVGRVAFDRVTGLYCAALAAFDPYLTYYAQETRMYSMEAFLSLLATLAWLKAIVEGRRRWLPLLVATLDLMVYTHNWGLFFCVGLAAATVLLVRDRLRDFGIAAAAVAIVYLPWLPTLAEQAAHTGAPWATRPNFHDLVLAPGAVLSGDAPLMAFALAGGAGLAAVVRGRRDRERQLVLALAATVGAAVGVAWLASQVSPAWAARYFAVVLGPLLAVGARALVRARRLGLFAFVAVVFLWMGFAVRNNKENANRLAVGLAAYVRPGTLVVSTHPEQIPVLRYYLGAGLRWATTMGPVPDSRIFDWRDAVSRLRSAPARRLLKRYVASVPRGGDFVVVTPVFRDYRAWESKWTHLVWKTSLRWSALLAADPQVELVAHVQTDEVAVKQDYFKLLQAFVYRRVR